MLFRDRRDAGRRLAAELLRLKNENPVIVALPRGGVPVGFEISRRLDAPLEVIPVRKLGVPTQPEFGFGAIAPDAMYLDERTVRMLRLSSEQIEGVVAAENAELERRQRLYRGSDSQADFSGKTVILVDDGLATGVTARAAVRSIQKQKPQRLILAIPVAAPESANELELEVDEVICLAMPEDFFAVGTWYEHFGQTTDDEVLELLSASRRLGKGEVRNVPEAVHRDVSIPAGPGPIRLAGDLVIPRNARGIVLFAHGSGSSRRSPRNRYVAEQLQSAGLATLLFDLLTTEEEAADYYTGHYRFNIRLLGERLGHAVKWVSEFPETRLLTVGCFGASTGAAAALVAAAEYPDIVHAVVSRGGRPDMAEERLARVEAPTLLIVGSLDQVVIELNREACRQLRCEKELRLVKGATHLFEEPGALEQVAVMAADWFRHHLQAATVEAQRGMPSEERRAATPGVQEGRP
jgi:putative phosphoribosyl transferase